MKKVFELIETCEDCPYFKITSDMKFMCTVTKKRILKIKEVSPDCPFEDWEETFDEEVEE